MSEDILLINFMEQITTSIYTLTYHIMSLNDETVGVLRFSV